MSNETIQTILTRRSWRKYKPEPLPPDILDAVLEAGTYAPTAMGKQSPVIVAVTDPIDRKAVQELNQKARGFSSDPYYGAPAILLVLAPSDAGTAVEDGACVLNTMAVAAHALGAATCWIHGEKEMFELPEGKDLLEKWELPLTLRGIGSLAIGYGDGPAPEPRPRKADYIKRF